MEIGREASINVFIRGNEQLNVGVVLHLGCFRFKKKIIFRRYCLIFSLDAPLYYEA